MTTLREKAREIKAAGEAERGNFEAGGIPLRMYKFWLENSNSKRANSIKHKGMRENFCHFWRVVAIWAPLMFVFKKVVDTLDNRNVLVGLGLACVLIIVLGGMAAPSFGIALLFTLAIVLGVFGFLSGVFKASGILDNPTNHEDVVANKIFSFGMLVPTAWVSYPLTKAVRFIMDNWKYQYTNFFKAFFKTVLIIISVGLVIGVAVSIVMDSGWIGLLIALGIIVGVLALIAGLIFLGGQLENYVRGRRALAETELRERIHNMTPKEYDEWINSTTEPGKVKKFFMGIGDFLILIGQVVRVNKWKICPTVEIKTK